MIVNRCLFKRFGAPLMGVLRLYATRPLSRCGDGSKKRGNSPPAKKTSKPRSPTRPLLVDRFGFALVVLFEWFGLEWFEWFEFAFEMVVVGFDDQWQLSMAAPRRRSSLPPSSRYCIAGVSSGLV